MKGWPRADLSKPGRDTAWAKALGRNHLESKIQLEEAGHTGRDKEPGPRGHSPNSSFAPIKAGAPGNLELGVTL